uniref:Ribosome receptor lysine/proline rich domain-containing protein n=1 Tax=Denticeps clupeoides TaxID=299321 RepID=A0AAY4A8H7_9TELE
MDVYDPQTLGFVVFGGFMVFSAIGIALVSTLSMKEMSYEEALAQQRQELGKGPAARADKKKKPLEKKNRAKKKDDKASTVLPESEPEASVVEPEPKPEPVQHEGEPQPVAEPRLGSTPAPVPEASPEPHVTPKPVISPTEPTAMPACAPVIATVTPATPSPKDKRKKKVAKAEPATTKPSPAPEVVAKEVPIKDVLVKSVAQVAPETASVAPPTTPAAVKDPNVEGSTKKKGSKKKSEPPATPPADSRVALPFKALVAALTSMAFSDGEMTKLTEVLRRKDAWQRASQKGDPLAVVRKQLEEKERQLAAEQENGAAAKTRLRELAKRREGQVGVAAEVGARRQEVAALQGRMQASSQDSLAQSQQLHGKIQALQEQLENGPNAQLARLQQENSILRDALNQATSQSESRSNSEMAKLRQDCVRLGREVSERGRAQQAEEERRKAAEAKLAATEEPAAKVQVSCRCRGIFTWVLLSRSSELQKQVLTTEAELHERCSELETLRKQVAPTSGPRADCSVKVNDLQDALKERGGLVDTLQDEISKLKEELQTMKSTEMLSSLKGTWHGLSGSFSSISPWCNNSISHLTSLEKDARLLSLEDELQQLKEEMEQVKNKSNELREKNWSAMEALAAAEKRSEEKLVRAQSAQDLRLKLRESEGLRESLKDECERYRAVLGEKVGAARRPLTSDLDVRLERVGLALKEQVLLLEAQLERQLETLSDTQRYEEELAQLKGLLSASQAQLDAARLQAQTQTAELSLVGDSREKSHVGASREDPLIMTRSHQHQPGFLGHTRRTFCPAGEAAEETKEGTSV